MKKGLLKESTIREETPNGINTSDEYVRVQISDKSDYGWEAYGRAGMVVIRNANDTEVDIIGTPDDVVKLLATSMIKVRELMGKSIVDKAIELYGR